MNKKGENHYGKVKKIYKEEGVSTENFMKYVQEKAAIR